MTTTIGKMLGPVQAQRTGQGQASAKTAAMREKEDRYMQDLNSVLSGIEAKLDEAEKQNQGKGTLGDSGPLGILQGKPYIDLTDDEKGFLATELKRNPEDERIQGINDRMKSFSTTNRDRQNQRLTEKVQNIVTSGLDVFAASSPFGPDSIYLPPGYSQQYQEKYMDERARYLVKGYKDNQFGHSSVTIQGAGTPSQGPYGSTPEGGKPGRKRAMPTLLAGANQMSLGGSKKKSALGG